MDNYIKVNAQDVCEITSSKRIYASDYIDNGVPFYRGKEIIEKQKGLVDVSTKLFISEHKYLKIKEKFGVPETGDLLLTSVGTLGIPYIVKSGEKFYFKDGNLIWFRKLKRIVSEYLYYWLLSPAGKAELKKCTIGASQAAFTIVLLKNIVIFLPPIGVQNKIAAILSAYDDLIENNLRRIKILEEMAQNLYREWFVNFRFPGHEQTRFVDSSLGCIPEGWEIVNLEDIAYQVRNSIKPETLKPDTPYVGLEHIPRRSITLTSWGHASEVQSIKYVFENRDILFGKIRPYFHKVIVAPLSGICSSDAIVIRAKSVNYFGVVLSCTASSEFVEHAAATSQGTKMPRANWDVLMKYQIPLPPQPILDYFNNVINDIIKLLQNLVFRNIKLHQTRDLLLPKLISGEVDVSALDINVLEEEAV